MDDRTYEYTKKRIHGMFLRLVEAMGLGDVRIDVSYTRDHPPHHEDGSAETAYMQPNWSYNHALLTFHVAMFVDLDDDYIAEIILHELWHYVVHPISRYGQSSEYDALEERVCTEAARIARALIRATGDEVAGHWRSKVKSLEKEIKKLMKEQSAAVPA